MIRPFLLSLALIPAMPAVAQGLAETHREVAMPIGKSVKLYRPVTRSDCAAATRHHQAGKMLYVPATVDADARCATEFATKAKTERVAAR